MEKKVSVIIPVYNAEKYLSDCLISVLEQTLDSVEIVCVNDGSTDSSQSILEKFEQKYENVNVLCKENGGVSSARNIGITASEGKYIVFLDSDDMLDDPTALKTLFDMAQKDELDELFFDAHVIFENEEVKEKNQNYVTYYKRKKSYPGVFTGPDLFVQLQSSWDFKPSPCLQMIRRGFLLENKISFPEGIVHEDEVFTVQCITLAERAAYLNQPFYGRRVRADSIMTTTKKAESIQGYFYGIRIMLEFAKSNVLGKDDEFISQYYERIRIMLELCGKSYKNESQEEKKEVIARIREEDRPLFLLFVRHAERAERLYDQMQKARKELEHLEYQLETVNAVRSELSDKLEKTYAEKSELNRRLQTTYEEKRQRGDEINRLKKELEEEKRKEEKIKNSYSYKIGKTITYIPRKIRKIARK
ncbi:MAG TPA: glycosyltransferase [Candidatus Mediterraneibacter stercoripullorum]|nr:glycosyltransferase [Candidatus Mediterraneibacter stercoripullorum]